MNDENKFMKALFWSLILSWILFPNSIISAQSSNCEEAPFSIPEIKTTENGKNNIVPFKTFAIYRVNKPGVSDQYVKEIDQCNLSDNTKTFLSNEFKKKDRHITSDQPITKTVTISLTEQYSRVVVELYIFNLGLRLDDLPKGGVALETLLVDKNGRILWGKDKDPYSFVIGKAKKNETDNKIFVDILTNLPGRHDAEQTAVIETYLYSDGKLQKTTSKQMNLIEYWN